MQSSSTSKLENIPEPLRAAIRSSNQWKHERSKELATTSCWSFFFPPNNHNDVAFSAWLGQDEAYVLQSEFGGDVFVPLQSKH